MIPVNLFNYAILYTIVCKKVASDGVSAFQAIDIPSMKVII